MMEKNTTLVIGASTNPARYSFLAINMLLEYEHEVKAIGLKSGQIKDVTIETSKISWETIDIVTLYLNSARQKEYYDYIISLKPRRVIFNPGTENPEFYTLLEKNSIEVVVACTLVLLRTNQY